MIVVSNTTPLIGLAIIGRFDLFHQLFGELFIAQVGILLKAKQVGLVPLLRPELKELQQQGFSLSQTVMDSALRQAGEL
jgi:predicted nucleic acid-binding protein